MEERICCLVLSTYATTFGRQWLEDHYATEFNFKVVGGGRAFEELVETWPEEADHIFGRAQAIIHRQEYD